MSRFVRPEIVKVDLTDGDWLLLKGKLTAGEQRDVFNRMVKNQMSVSTTGKGTERIELDPLAAGHSTILAYLLDWSLTDDDGRVVSIKDEPLDVVSAALDALDYDSYEEILNAVQAHEATINAARAQEKKRRGVPNKSGTISLLPADVVGVTSG